MKSPNPQSAPGGTPTALVVSVVVALVLVVAACGAGGASSEQDLATRSVAEQNEADLTLTDDIATTGLLVAETGTNSAMQLYSYDLSQQSGIIFFNDNGRAVVLDAAIQTPWAPVDRTPDA